MPWKKHRAKIESMQDFCWICEFEPVVFCAFKVYLTIHNVYLPESENFLKLSKNSTESELW